MSAPFQKGKLTIDSVSWTPILSLFFCNNIVIRNLGAVDVKIRTNSSDPNTEDVLPAGTQEVDVATSRSGAGMAFRFPSGATVAYAQATSGTGPLMVTCLE